MKMPRSNLLYCLIWISYCFKLTFQDLVDCLISLLSVFCQITFLGENTFICELFLKVVTFDGMQNKNKKRAFNSE